MPPDKETPGRTRSLENCEHFQGYGGFLQTAEGYHCQERWDLFFVIPGGKF